MLLKKKKKRFLDFSDFRIDIRGFPGGSSGLDSVLPMQKVQVPVPGWGAKIPCAVWYSQKIKTNKKTPSN